MKKIVRFGPWLTSIVGKGINVDKYAGNQCVDVIMSFVQYIYPQHTWEQLLGYGNAKDLYAGADPKQERLQKIPYKAGMKFQRGDIVFYGAVPGNPFGHVLVVTSRHFKNLGSTFNAVEQNGFNPSGVAYKITRPYTDNIIGVLRPKVRFV